MTSLTQTYGNALADAQLIFQAKLDTDLTDSKGGLVPTNTIECSGYFPFNGNTNDASTFAHNLTNYGATLTQDRFLANDNAYDFTGGGMISDNVYDVSGGTAGWTISCWFKMAPTSSAYTIWSFRRSSDNGENLRLTIEQTTGYPFIWKVTAAGTGALGLKVLTNVADDQWHHLVCTYRTDAKTDMIVDGVYYAGTNTAIIRESNYFRIESGPMPKDDFCIIPASLSQEEAPSFYAINNRHKFNNQFITTLNGVVCEFCKRLNYTQYNTRPFVTEPIISCTFWVNNYVMTSRDDLLVSSPWMRFLGAKFSVYHSGSASEKYSDFIYLPNVTYLVGFTYNANTGILRLYKNNAIEKTYTGLTGSFAAGSFLAIGDRGGSVYPGEEGFSGWISDIRIYKYELDVADFNQLYNNGTIWKGNLTASTANSSVSVALTSPSVSAGYSNQTQTMVIGQ